MSRVGLLLRKGLRDGMAPFDAYIAGMSGLVVPHKIFNLWELTDLNIKQHNDYLEAGLTPHFAPLAVENFM